ncbi:MAG: SDR family oxidoreductase [Anaerolineae bacterium]|jgi:hypothetical protein|nr:SDR family oxidoreductase [Anaerolineae bacterium]
MTQTATASTASPHRRPDAWRAKYGPWAVITGASDGIGRAFALAAAESGLNVVLVARRRPLLEALAAEISRLYGVEAQVVAADLSSPNGVEQVVSATARLDVGLLVACAGYGTTGRFTEADLTTELDMLMVNCRAVVEMAHHYGQRFAQRGRGGVVMMGSLLGFQGVPMSAHYAATKAFVQSLAEGLHLELAPLGVDVLSSAPGPTRSGFADRANMQMGMADQPETVAKSTLDALGRTVTVRPAFVAKFLGYSLGMLPRGLRSRILGRTVASMIRE